VAFATFLEQLYNITTVTKVQKALRCQQAEHTFGDTPCGIMDQYISTMGSKGNLLLIDCRSTEYQLIPFGSSGGNNDSTGVDGGGDGNNSKPCPVILITNSNVKHQLSGSEYPDRVRQCKEAVQCLQTKYPYVLALRDANMSMLDAIKDTMTSLVYARAKHCITEDIRTQSTVEALRNNNFELVGQYMTASHYSLQHDYEVSCVELDLLVQIALTVPGVYGSRMTGGGFGGCTVTLVDKDAVDQLKDALTVNYYKQTLLKCSFYECEPCDGTNAIELTEDILKEALSTDFTTSSAAAIILDISNRHQQDDNDDDLQVDDSVQVTYDPEDEDGVDDCVDDLDDIDDVDDDKYLDDSSDKQYWNELVAYAAPLIIVGISISIGVMLVYYRKGK
jgi:galactokinase